MNRLYYLPILFFVIALITDFISIASPSPSETLPDLEANIESFLRGQARELLQDDQIKLFDSDQLELKSLNTIKVVASEVEEKDLYVSLFKQSKLIYWSGQASMDTICRSFKKEAYLAQVCLNLYDSNGTFNQRFQDSTFPKLDVEKNDSSDLMLFGQGIQINKINRAIFIQRVSTLLYLISLILLILVSINQNQIAPILISIGIRCIMLIIPWQSNYSDLEIAEPIFSQSSYSAIDLFIDAILIFGLISIFIKKRYLAGINPKSKYILHLGLFFLVLGLMSHIRLVQLMVNSDMTLKNLSNISQFTTTDLFGLSSILILLLSIFLYSNSLFDAIKHSKINKSITYLSSVGSILAGLAIAHWTGLDLNIWILALFLGSWVLLFDLFTDVKQKNITWLIWWAIFLSVYLSSIFFNFDIKKEIQNRSKFLAEAIHPVPSDSLQKIADSPELYSLDTTLLNLVDLPPGMKIDKSDFMDYVQTKSALRVIDIQIYRKDNASIFYTTDSYIPKAKLVEVDSSIWYNPILNTCWFQRQISDSIEYAIHLNLASSAVTHDYRFNYYQNDQLIHEGLKLSTSNLNSLLAADKNYIFKDSNVFVKWHKGPDLLVSKKSFDSLIKPIALFSLLFALVILFGFTLSFSNVWLDFLPEDWPFKVQRIDSLNSKIQVSLILVILLSFVVIALITNSFLNNFLGKEKEKYYRDKIVAISNDLRHQTDIAQSAEEMIAIASNFIGKTGSIHDVDITIHVIDSSLRNIPYFNYAYFTKSQQQSAFTEKSDQGMVSYIPLKYDNETIAYTAVNYRNQITNKVQVFDFLGSIFNVYVFLFLIASVLAIFLARSITKPLALLNQKLGKLKLGKRNELIAWDREDEIGNLITNYNNMVHQLEESAQVLAKTERDSAWREMAKQVAHEIKNPLTPMKLSIQYLEKAIKQNPAEAIAISKKISSTLLEQIDNLAEIANAFGNFAELPQSSNVKIEINEVVEMVHNLFRKREDMDITLAVPIDPIYVYGDKNQLIRILNNLVKNAVESVPQSRRGVIRLKLYTQNDNAIIQVSDNGEGIPEDMQDKIFQPKFTTKDSGSGLGLAISSNMIESMNGRLYFESKYGEGTDFYIELNIIRPSNYQDQDKRITLD